MAPRGRPPGRPRKKSQNVSMPTTSKINPKTKRALSSSVAFNSQIEVKSGQKRTSKFHAAKHELMGFLFMRLLLRSKKTRRAQA